MQEFWTTPPPNITHTRLQNYTMVVGKHGIQLFEVVFVFVAVVWCFYPHKCTSPIIFGQLGCPSMLTCQMAWFMKHLWSKFFHTKSKEHVYTIGPSSIWDHELRVSNFKAKTCENLHKQKMTIFFIMDIFVDMFILWRINAILKCMNECDPMCRVSTTIVNEIENMSFSSPKLKFCFYLFFYHACKIILVTHTKFTNFFF